jgi:hypothetical protein
MLLIIIDAILDTKKPSKLNKNFYHKKKENRWKICSVKEQFDDAKTHLTDPMVQLKKKTLN